MPRSKSSAPEPERLQKVLARLGLASRREAEEWIKAGRLTINDHVATLGVKVVPRDRLKLDGRLIHRYEPATTPVFVCHRSPGDTGELIEKLPGKAGKRFISISPMPRVDGGLELLTADGEAAARLQRAAHHLTSEFSVRIKGELSDEQRDRILEGTLDRGTRLDVDSCEPGGGEGSNRWYTLVVRGGSGKDVRQLFERQGALVSRIMRIRLGPLALDPRLGRGRFRELTREEISALKAAAAERRNSAP
jgi:23S rRNA pseudouridine2605 synthase